MQKYDIRSDLIESLESGMTLIALPIPRLKIEEKIGPFDGVTFYPPYSVKLDQLRIVSYPEYEMREIERKGYGESLAWSQSAITRVNLEDFKGTTLAVFATQFNWNHFFDATLLEHQELLRKLAEHVESVMDIFRFSYCRLDLPDTLPGRVGTLDQMPPFSAALFYSLSDHEAYIIASLILTHNIVAGLGLELDNPVFYLPINDGEVGNIAKHALNLFSSACEANTETQKFIQCMSLLEFLASPGEYIRMDKAKGCIATHSAKSRSEYNSICEEFRQFTSLKNEQNEQIGYRTLVVHHGKKIEELLEKSGQRQALFKRLQTLISAVIHSLIKMSGEDWEAVEAYRLEKRKQLGVQP